MRRPEAPGLVFLKSLKKRPVFLRRDDKSEGRGNGTRRVEKSPGLLCDPFLHTMVDIHRFQPLAGSETTALIAELRRYR